MSQTSYELYSPMRSIKSLFKQSNPVALSHADEFDIMSIPGMTLPMAMFAGSLAGVSEHICMFPIDTIKTRMQITAVKNAPVYANVYRAIIDITKTEGFPRLYRGLSAVAISAVPSHAVYFGTFEIMKAKLGASRSNHTPFANALSGICASIPHDAINTPMDVVKQRLQVYNSSYSSIWQCIKGIYQKEGLVAFYQSYPTTVLLNIPYMAVHFASYEGMHTLLHDTVIDDTPLADILSGAVAGGMGGMISNPLDVVKTRLQTQELPFGAKRLGALEMIKKITIEEGLAGFTKGASARIMMFVPSAAICWTVYEGLKRFFIVRNNKNCKAC